MGMSNREMAVVLLEDMAECVRETWPGHTGRWDAGATEEHLAIMEVVLQYHPVPGGVLTQRHRDECVLAFRNAFRDSLAQYTASLQGG